MRIGLGRNTTLAAAMAAIAVIHPADQAQAASLVVTGGAQNSVELSPGQAVAVAFELGEPIRGFDLGFTALCRCQGVVAINRNDFGPGTNSSYAIFAQEFSGISEDTSFHFDSGAQITPGVYIAVIWVTQGTLYMRAGGSDAYAEQSGIGHGFDFFSQSAGSWPPAANFDVMGSMGLHYRINGF